MNKDAQYILKLMALSEALNEEQKKWWIKKLPNMGEFDRAKFIEILEKEVEAINHHLKKSIELKKRFTQKKIKSLYDYAEKKLKKEEKDEFQKLEDLLEKA